MGIGLSLYLHRPQEFQTAFGEQRSFLLEDGSRVTLNTASKISVDFRADRRLVRLLQGEALFEVVHDTHRPFDVQSGQAMARAVGTQFDVDMRAKATTVTVVEGRVAVISDVGLDSLLSDLPLPGVPAPAIVPKGLVILSPADRVVITSAGTASIQHLTNGAAATSWTTHQLIFEHRPLSEVAEEFNRYNKQRIEISSSELKRQEVTGVFQYTDPQSFLGFLSKVPGVEIHLASDGHQVVTLRAADPVEHR
jgi:transmembrane sensor